MYFSGARNSQINIFNSIAEYMFESYFMLILILIAILLIQNVFYRTGLSYLGRLVSKWITSEKPWLRKRIITLQKVSKTLPKVRGTKRNFVFINVILKTEDILISDFIKTKNAILNRRFFQRKSLSPFCTVQVYRVIQRAGRIRLQLGYVLRN